MAYVAIVHATFQNKADADHIFDQSKAVATNASVVRIGEPDERTSHAFVAEEDTNGELIVDRSWHKDSFGIIRDGEPYVGEDPPPWIQPTGSQDAYPATNVRDEETRVTHNGQIYRNTHGDGNTWEPGVVDSTIWELVE